MIRISFDYDSTLSLKKVKEMFGAFDRSLVDLYIVTSRETGKSWNRDLYEDADLLGIDHDRVILTDGAFKWSVLNKLNISIHFDDMPDEIMMIQANCSNTLGVLVTKNLLGDINYMSCIHPEPSIQMEHENFG